MMEENKNFARQTGACISSSEAKRTGARAAFSSEAKKQLRSLSGALPFAAAFLFLLFILSISSIASAQPATISSTLYAPSQQSFGFDNYIRATLSAAALMAGLMVLAYLAGAFFQNEDAKQLARSEFLQTAASVLLAALLLGVLLAVDTGLHLTSASITSPCEGRTLPTSPIDMTKATLLNQYAFCYAQNLNEMAIAQGDTTIQKSVTFAKKAYHMEGFQTDMWVSWFVGLTRRPDANLRLDSEVMGQEFALLTAYMISLQGQLSFLQYVVPALAPALLFLGVIFRSLFFTRRLGGLMLAAGAGLLLVWPATYLLSWFTLQVSVFGPSVMGDQPGTTCPASCKIMPPAGYNISAAASPNSWGSPGPGSPYAQGAMNENDMKANAPAPDLGNETAWLGMSIQTCYPEYPYTQDKNTGKRTYTQSQDSRSTVPVDASDACPTECRYLPTPTDQGCDLTACDKVPLACKAIRAMNLTATNPPDNCNDCRKSCPDFCLTILPQVKYANPAEPKQGVVPTSHASSCSDSPGDATKCPLYCRSYLHAGTNTISYSTSDCKDACQKTLAKTDTSTPSPTNLPDCMLGIPAALVECNAPGVCGPSLNLDAAIKSGKTDFCPTECRVFFNTSAGSAEPKYMDPTFAQYCTGSGVFAKACDKQCPIECKVKAGPQDPTLQNSFSLGVAQPPSYSGSFSVQTDTGTVTCAEAPTFANGKMDSNSDGSCARCPLSCRFRNPPSILDLNNQSNYFLSGSHYALRCSYSASSPVITYSGACGNAGFPSTWLKFASEVTAGTSLSIVQHDPPACAPNESIYMRTADSDPLCPIFLAPMAPYVVGTADFSLPPVITATIPPNADVSAECSTADAQKYCTGSDPSGQPYCPDSCKPNRAVVGPFYCHLNNQYSPLSTIPDNADKCTACSGDNADHSQGPQCQVWLTDWSGANGQIPAGCSPNCNPSTFDPTVTSAICNGFCYPRLAIPSLSSSGGACKDYQPAPSSNPNSREFASCLACPADCRYDYVAPGGDATNVKRPASEDSRCGWNFGTPASPVTPCLSITSGRLRKGDIPDVNNTRYYSCTRTEAGQNHWVSTNPSVDSAGDKGCNAAWYPISKFANQSDANKKCGAGTFSNTTSDVYSCTPVHKYPALDSLITSSGGSSGYRECGDIGLNDQNPGLNLCGARTFGGASVQLCKNDRTSATSCFAHFNALAVACMPVTDVSADYTDPANNPTKAYESCQNCPLFCRIDNGGSVCSPWLAGGNPPQCDMPPSSPVQCDRRTTPGSGFCGIPLSDFKIGQGCSNYSSDSGVGCPARCRISVPGLDAPYNCSGGDIGQACSRDSLNSACTASPPGNPCGGCGDCETDCRSTPYVRQSCDDVCLPTDFGNGASPITPKDLLMAWEGASGNADWRSLGSLGIAAFLLPIFNIIITLAFIRTLSPVLGGDVEIPGILKVL